MPLFRDGFVAVWGMVINMENTTVNLKDIYSKDIHPKKKKDVRPKKKKRVRIFFIVLLLIIASLAVGLTAFTNWMSGKLNHKDIDQSFAALGIGASYQTNTYDYIDNIALFGIDARGDDTGRSDAIMILSVDHKRNKVKIISLMRDSYVKMDGHDYTKLCHAYVYGGAPLAIKTINQNYNLNIQDYVTVNFDSLAQVIDAVGGVTIDISEDEREDANNSVREYAEVYNKTPTYIEKSGEQLLNGMQAVAYARIRYVGNSDYERTERQRKVLEQVFNNLLKMSPLKYPEILSTILPQLETSLTAKDITELGISMIISGSSNIEQTRFPLDEDIDHKNSTINGVSYVVSDLSVTSAKLHSYIFDDVTPS